MSLFQVVKTEGRGECASKTVTFDTTRFGTLSVQEEKIINFVKGIPGFEHLRRFILIDHDQEGLLKWMQSVEDPMVAFLLTDPGIYKPGYSPLLKIPDIDSLGAKDSSALVTLVTISPSKTDKKLCVNLKSPFVFNSLNMKAIQCIIDRDDYQSSFVIKF